MTNRSFAKQTEKNLFSYSPIHLFTIKKCAFTLAEVFSPHCAGFRKTAFTLAEVLITLGIIGIVAAIIMPSVMLNVRNQKLKAQFRVAHNLISNAVYRMSMDEPNIVGSNCGYSVYNENSMRNFNTQFAGHFYDAKIMNNGNSNLPALAKLGYGYSGNKIKKVSNDNINFYHINGDPIVLKNGMIIITSKTCVRFGLSNGTPRPVGFLIDINGAKGPNRIGFDIFDFEILKGNRLNTQNLDYTKNQTAQTPSSDDCNYKSSNKLGYSCTLYAFIDKSPIDKNKPYFESLPAK